MKRNGLLFVVGLAAGLGGTYLYQQRFKAPKPGFYESAARRLDGAAALEACDRNGGGRRVRLARLLDHFEKRIGGLFQARVAKDFPQVKMEQVGPVFLRVSEPLPAKPGVDISSWSWEEAQGIFLQTQTSPEATETKERWRDFSTMLRYLLEKDTARLLYGKQYLPPADTPQTFRPNASTARTGPREITVRLNPGEFRGAEKQLEALFAREWSRDGFRLRVRFENTPGLYVLRANNRSARSFVNHRQKVLVLANYTYTRTAAHELGHILGFDDHYYSVWHGKNCYYTQESYLDDLMSNSERGRVTAEHWQLLDRAYPWKKPPLAAPFEYRFARRATGRDAAAGGATSKE